MAAVKLKDLLSGQERLSQRENLPLDQSQDKLQKLVDAISQKTSPSVSLNSNQKIFEDFVKQTQKREELLKDATTEQIVIFKHLEDTIKKLKDASHADSVNLRKTLENLARNLKATPANAAKSSMMKALTAPAVSASKQPSAIPTPTISPSEYKLYDNAASVGDTEERTYKGWADEKDNSDSGSGLWDMFKDVAAFKTIKDAGKYVKNKTMGGATAKSSATGGKYTQGKNGQWYQKGLRGAIKKPGLISRGINAVANAPGAKTVGKALAKAPIIGPLITAGIMGYNEYQDSGDLLKAAVVGGSGAIAGEVSGLAGLVAGTAVAGPVGGLVGSVALGSTGAYAGGKVGGSVYEALTGSHGAKVSSEIRKLNLDNQDILLNREDRAPVIINNNSTSQSPVSQPTYMPQAPVRPSESALDNWINRSFQR